MKNISADVLIDTFNNHVDKPEPDAYHHGTIVGVLKKACRSDSRYRQVLKVLTGRTTSKMLNPAQWHALYKFTLPVKPEGGHWQSGHGDDILDAWCNTLIRHADGQEGQLVFA